MSVQLDNLAQNLAEFRCTHFLSLPDLKAEVHIALRRVCHVKHGIRIHGKEVYAKMAATQEEEEEEEEEEER